jgi:hypothetical protein
MESPPQKIVEAKAKLTFVKIVTWVWEPLEDLLHQKYSLLVSLMFRLTDQDCLALERNPTKRG